MSEINNIAIEGGPLALQAHHLAAARPGMGFSQALGLCEGMEAASWQPWRRAKTAAYGLALWACGHIQAIDLRTRADDWHPAPIYWRPLYVPPSLLVAAGHKPMAGSVVSGRWRGVQVKGSQV